MNPHYAMKLVDQFEIEIADEKLLSYLLSPTHRIGNHKAEVFEKVGLNQNNWKELKKILLQIATDGEANFQKENRFGKVYRVEEKTTTPSGEIIILRTAWLVEHGSNTARFITAYPIKL